ncbi:MAG: peptide-methionine (S)-S-oxide reductase MsrA [Parachlamydiaceae bacterium]|nr:peptide-methionine (S)-S-oxide reductase MsrA [Parachlamydiaceae bacterium]
MSKKINVFIYILSFCLILFTTTSYAEEKLGDTGKNEYAAFASGCFWCTQQDFDQIKGVISTTVGYTGGKKINPTYEEVSAGGTGHVESLQVIYDSSEVSYQDLLDFYWHTVDPTRNDGQFCDKGSQYRPVIFYHSENQKELSEKYKNELISDNRINPILVEILPAKTFYPAEDYHQNYYKKNPIRYKFYRNRCGRDNRLKEIWGTTQFSNSELVKKAS